MEMECNNWYAEYFKYVDDWKATVSVQDIKDVLVSINKMKKGERLSSRIIKLFEKEKHVRSPDKMKWHNMKLLCYEDEDENEKSLPAYKITD